MNYVRKTFDGEILENEKSVAKGYIDVDLSDYDISLHEHAKGMSRGGILTVRPFCRNMFLGTSIEKGYQLTMEGSAIGSYRIGPLGHPGDGEYKIFNVIKASISGQYDHYGLNIDISVLTDSGSEVCFRTREEVESKYEPFNLTIKFQVPLEKLNEFLNANFTDEFLAKLKTT